MDNDLYMSFGDLVITVSVMCGIVWLCVKSPLLCTILEILACLFVGFGAFALGIYGAAIQFDKGDWMPGVLALLMSGALGYPAAAITLPKIRENLKNLKNGERLWL